ncbi:MAG: SIS domain-containing protein [Bifidobacteriaceae bacterium]|jgi:fructoselysine-6-P-deglycase FrlB-like protein|nr:SIS domain-containing protein [Bifidobacteriaceae bacterium]
MTTQLDHLLVTGEIESQPECWAEAAALAPTAPGLPSPGEKTAVIGCGTSWFIAMAYAALRERAGHGWTDAFTATELPLARDYDRVVAISRSGTTTEVAEALAGLNPATASVAIVGVRGTPVADQADHVIGLEFADERSVVQTRFATSTLALLRAWLGEDLGRAIEDCRAALEEPIGNAWIEATQAAFLGRGWTIGLAQEAALKLREASLSFTEAYPAMDYRHGPIALAEPGRLVWMFGPPPEGLRDDVRATGATWINSTLDPMADLVRVQRLAVARGVARGLDPDHPRHLTRSVILDQAMLDEPQAAKS